MEPEPTLRAGVKRMGPAGTPCFKALPRGVADGGVRMDCGGRGLFGFHTMLFFSTNLTFFFFVELDPGVCSEVVPFDFPIGVSGNGNGPPELEGSMASTVFALFRFLLPLDSVGELDPDKLFNLASLSDSAAMDANFSSRFEITESSTLTLITVSASLTPDKSPAALLAPPDNASPPFETPNFGTTKLCSGISVEPPASTAS